MTNKEIRVEGARIAREHGDYSLLLNNCQDYVKRLLAAITASTIPRGVCRVRTVDGREMTISLDPIDSPHSTVVLPEPDACAQYRFNQDALDSSSTYESLHGFGFIFPESDIILVNVKLTDRPGVWTGEVKDNNGISGYLLGKAVERCDMT